MKNSTYRLMVAGLLLAFSTASRAEQYKIPPALSNLAQDARYFDGAKPMSTVTYGTEDQNTGEKINHQLTPLSENIFRNDTLTYKKEYNYYSIGFLRGLFSASSADFKGSGSTYISSSIKSDRFPLFKANVFGLNYKISFIFSGSKILVNTTLLCKHNGLVSSSSIARNASGQAEVFHCKMGSDATNGVSHKFEYDYAFFYDYGYFFPIYNEGSDVFDSYKITFVK